MFPKVYDLWAQSHGYVRWIYTWYSLLYSSPLNRTRYSKPHLRLATHNDSITRSIPSWIYPRKLSCVSHWLSMEIFGLHRASVSEKYYNLATCVLIIYDHFLTFDAEVKNIWMQRWTFPKLLWFVVSRPVSCYKSGQLWKSFSSDTSPQSYRSDRCVLCFSIIKVDETVVQVMGRHSKTLKTSVFTSTDWDIEDELTTWTFDECYRWIWFRTIGDELVTLAVSGVLALRIWALFERGEWSANKTSHYMRWNHVATPLCLQLDGSWLLWFAHY